MYVGVFIGKWRRLMKWQFKNLQIDVRQQKKMQVIKFIVIFLTNHRHDLNWFILPTVFEQT